MADWVGVSAQVKSANSRRIHRSAINAPGLPSLAFLPVLLPLVGVAVVLFLGLKDVSVHEGAGAAALGGQVVGGLVELEGEGQRHGGLGLGFLPAFLTGEPLAGVVAEGGHVPAGELLLGP